MTNFRRRALLGLCGLLVLAVLLAVLGRLLAGWYLESERFRLQIETSLSRTLKADGTLMPIQRAGVTFYSDGFAAHGKEGAFFSDLRADQIRAVFNWRGLLDHRWQIDELTAQNVDIRFAERNAASRESSPSTSAKGSPPGEQRSAESGKSNWRLDLRKASVARSTWHWGQAASGGAITDAAFTLAPSGDSWLIDATSGKVSQTGWPDVTIESAKLRYAGPALFITESSLRTGDGTLAVTGEVDFARLANINAHFDNLPLAPFLPPDWRLRLSGKIAGDTTIRAPLPNGTIHAEGKIHLIEGKVEALPLLDQIATFTRTERFRRMTLTRGSASFTRDDTLVTAKDIVIESEGLLRVEGSCTVVNGQIDGVFQIGVTGASLQWLPGSQAHVFTISHDGYFWAPLRLTGPASHPNEDLSRRLIAAAAGELLQDTQDTVRDTVNGLLDLIPH